MDAVELERNGWVFFYLYWGNVVLWLKRTSTKKLANRISYQIWHKGCLKGKFGRGVQTCEGGVQIRCDTGKRQNKTNFIFWIWKLSTPQVTWNVVFTTMQGNDLRYATSVFSITKPKNSTSEQFKRTINLHVRMQDETLTQQIIT